KVNQGWPGAWAWDANERSCNQDRQDRKCLLENVRERCRGVTALLKLENEWGRRSQRVFGMGIRSGSESGSEESVGRGHRKTGCQSARTLNSAHA
ncbi:hypothetical protein V1478_016167, partial [Vespula squamosa]